MPSPRSLAACAALLFAALSSLNAQSVATTPVGAMVYSFPATTAITTTYISVPLTNPPVFTGSVSGIAASTLTFEGTPFTAGGLVQAGNPYFLRILSGAQAGRTMLVSANTTNSVTLDTSDNSTQITPLTTVGFSVAQGDRVEIILGDTLASLFGNNTSESQLLFVAGTSSLNSDLVGFYDKNSSRFVSYFFSSSLGYWRNSQNSLNQNNLVIYPDSTIGITRRADRPAVSLTVTGTVPTVSPLVKVTGGVTSVYASTGVPVDVTLSQLTLTNWTKGTSNLNSDLLGVYSADSSRFETYYQRSDNNEWRRTNTGSVNQSNLVIPAGSGLAILKRATVTEATSFIKFPLPYNL